MAHGSLVNEVMSRSKGERPEVGMGATILLWSDRAAATIVNVSRDGREIDVREDFAERTDDNGMSDAQSYIYHRNPKGAIACYTLRQNGAWVRKGEPMRGGQRVLVGHRDHHHDYSF